MEDKYPRMSKKRMPDIKNNKYTVPNRIKIISKIKENHKQISDIWEFNTGQT